MLVPRVWEDRAAAALRPLRPGPELLKPETGLLLLLLLSWADASAVLITASVDVSAVTADGTVVSAVDSAVTAAVSANVSPADSAADPKDAADVSAADLLLFLLLILKILLLFLLLILKILPLFLPSLLLFPPAIRARSRCHVLPSKPPPKSRSPSCSSEL